jgi:hypothetical protein
MSHKWDNRVADSLTSWSHSDTQFGTVSRFTIKVKNTEEARGIGELLAYHEYTGIEPPTGATPTYGGSGTIPQMPHLDLLKHLSFDARKPQWHDDLKHIGICIDGVPEDDTGTLLLYGLALARVTVSNDDHTHVIVDPENPERLLSSTGGLGKIIWAKEDVEYAVVLWGEQQPWFRYELTEGWVEDGTEAKLLNLDSDDPIGGTDTASRITLTDKEALMDDQSSGDKGYCLMVGNKFIAIQASCS